MTLIDLTPGTVTAQAGQSGIVRGGRVLGGSTPQPATITAPTVQQG